MNLIQLNRAIEPVAKRMAATTAIHLARLIAHVLNGKEQVAPFTFGLKRRGFHEDELTVTIVVRRGELR